MPKIASASEDGSIKIWNTDSGECLRTLLGHTKVPKLTIDHFLENIE